MLVWFILTGASVVFVIQDSVSNGVTSWVQRMAWILVTVYTGPVGVFMYLLACWRPFPGGHSRFTSVTWEQGFNSEMHCLAGDATGIIIAASIVPVPIIISDPAVGYGAGLAGAFFHKGDGKVDEEGVPLTPPSVSAVAAAYTENDSWFVGGGWAADSFGDLDQSDTIIARGVGFRYQVARKPGLWSGFDVAFGPEDTVFYMQAGGAW